MPNLTPWFPGDVKPVRPGVYERDYGNGRPRFNHFDGEQWMFGAITPDWASEYEFLRSCAALMPWRGLASDPSTSGEV